MATYSDRHRPSSIVFTDEDTTQLLVRAKLPDHQYFWDMRALDAPHRPLVGELRAFGEPIDDGLRIPCPSCDATMTYVTVAGLHADQPVPDSRFRLPGTSFGGELQTFTCGICGARPYPQWTLLVK